jgi:membrane protease YdiL (CAAX protease family)
MSNDSSKKPAPVSTPAAKAAAEPEPKPQAHPVKELSGRAARKKRRPLPLPASTTDFTHWQWGPIAGVLITVLAFLVSQLLAGLLLLVILLPLGWTSEHVTAWFNTIAGQFFAVLISETLALAFLWLFLRFRGASWRMLGFARRPKWGDLGNGLVAFVIYFTLLLVLGGILAAALHLNTDQKQELGFDHVRGLAEKLLTLVSLVLLPPIAEETLFRGFLFTGLRKKLNLVWATIFTGILFALPHIFEGSGTLLWMAGIDTFLMSTVLCYTREKTGALYANILVHMLKNGVAFLYLYVFVTK